MAVTIVDKFLRLIGFEDEVVEEELDLLELKRQQQPDPGKDLNKERPKKGKVISLHNQSRMRVMVVEPNSFDDAKRVVDYLRGRQPVVLNLEETPGELAQRIIDFVSGATFATDGGVQKVGQGIFLFTPNNVDISAETRDAGSDDLSFPWVR